MIGNAKNLIPGARRPGEPTVGAGFARGLLDLAVSKGADRQALLQRARLDADHLADQDNRVPMSSYVALMRAGIELSGDPALALHYGEINISEVSVVGHIGRASETMRDALVQLNRYVRLIVEAEAAGPGDRFVIVHEDGEDWLVDTRINANTFPELTESAFAQLICGTREFAHDANRPFVKAVHVTHSRPAHWREYERVFRAPVVFDAARNAMQIDTAWHDYRVARSTPYVLGVLKAHADHLLNDLDAARSLIAQVEALAGPLLHTGEVNIDFVARKMGLGRQTLYRRLKAEGATFEAVLDSLRRRLAVHYLQDRKISVNETAYLVGFSDPAAFSRAFKRWTGASPRALRRP